MARMNQFPDEPFIFSYQAYSEKNKESSGGADFFEEGVAFQRAVSEIIERYSWREKKPDGKNIIISSEEKIRENFLPISSFTGFSAEQRNSIKNLNINSSTPIRWIQIESLIEPNKKIWSPLQAVSGHYTEKTRGPESLGKEPIIRYLTTNGLATSLKNRDEAILSGLLELIERDAFMVSYGNRWG